MTDHEDSTERPGSRRSAGHAAHLKSSDERSATPSKFSYLEITRVHGQLWRKDACDRTWSEAEFGNRQLSKSDRKFRINFYDGLGEVSQRSSVTAMEQQSSPG